jgi:hypothetical protein
MNIQLTVAEATRLNSVSEGTIRAEALFPKLVDAVRAAHAIFQARGVQPEAANASYPDEVAAEVAALSDDDRIDVLHDINEQLFDILSGYAPEGFYFGAHPDDGAAFGFWECEE